MKKTLLLATCLMALSAEPLQEPFEANFTIEATLPETKTPLEPLMPQANLSAESPLFDETPLSVHDVELQKPIPLALTPEEEMTAILQEEKEVAEEVARGGIIIDLRQVFAGAPTIYSILFALSIASVGIWIYTFLSLRDFSNPQAKYLKEEIHCQRYDSALRLCQESPSLLFGMVGAALTCRHHGSGAMLERMQAEGRRLSTSYWQKIGLLNEIAVVAPMLGLLGTVLGLFYAFYDLNRSAESISALFDGLGISVGTTVGGLVVAILALLLHSLAKYRLMKQLTVVEKEAETLVQSIRGKEC